MERNDLTKLSAELRRQIFEHVENTDLKVIRLCGSHTLTVTASPMLFRKAYVAARRGVLTSFSALTTHPVLRDYIQEVIFDSSYIDPATLTKYEKEKQDPCVARLFEEQETIQKNEIQYRLEEAFECMTRVRKVIYADMSRVPFLPGDSSDDIRNENYEDGPLLMRLESGNFSSMVDDAEILVESLSKAMRCRKLSTMPDDIRRRYGGFFVLMKVLSKHACASLQDLRLGSVVDTARSDFGVPHVAFSSESPRPVLRSFGRIFHGLRKLEMSITNLAAISPSFRGVFREYNGVTVDISNLSCALETAVNLEMLKLCGDERVSYIRISGLLSSLPLGRIKLLHFTYVAIDIPDLKDFLLKHCGTLRHMILADIFLSSGRWDGFATFVEQNMPYLEIILGLVNAKNHRDWRVHKFLPIPDCIPSPLVDIFQGKKNLQLRSWDLERIGEIQDSHRKHKQSDDAESEVLEIEEGEGESEYESDSTEELEYSSDDSSPEISGGTPRRKPDKDFFDSLGAEMQKNVEQLQKELEGCPAYECARALEGDSYEKARSYLIARFGYTELDITEPDMKERVQELKDMVQFYVSVEECREALIKSGSNVSEAREILEMKFDDLEESSDGASFDYF